MDGKNGQQYRFRIVISVLFTVLIVVFGVLFGQLIFWRTSDMLLEESKRYFAQVHDELALDFSGTRKTVAQTVAILGKTDITTATSLEERLKFLPIFQASLSAESNLATLQVGYDNGDYFIVRAVGGELLRNHFNAPAKTSLVVDNISRKADNKNYLQRFYFNPSLQELGRGIPEIAEYDPRTRPWYTAAIGAGRDIRTAPYLFHFMGQMGITISREAEGTGSVVAGDVTLYHLSKTLAKYRQTANSELILLEKKDQDYWVTAYGDPEKLVIREKGAPQRSRARDLGNPLLNYAADIPTVLEPFYNFSFKGRKWLGSTLQFGSTEVDELYLVLLSPEKELLSEARRLRSQTILYTALMIFLTIPITWLLARKISSPMQLLAKETKRISRFEFGTAAMPASFIKEVDELGLAMTMMEGTIGQFLSLISSLAGEQDFDKLLHRITEETMAISGADGAFTYVVDDTEAQLIPGTAMTRDKGRQSKTVDIEQLPTYDLSGDAQLVGLLNRGERAVTKAESFALRDIVTEQFGVHPQTIISITLENRHGESIGVLSLVYGAAKDLEGEHQAGRLAYIEA